MKSIKWFVFCLSICLPGLLTGFAQDFRSTTYMGYNPATGQNNLPQNIAYQYPAPDRSGFGPYPLFIWTSGTLEPYQDPLADVFVTQMAKRGFLAATVQYHNLNAVQRCEEYTARANAVYDAT